MHHPQHPQASQATLDLHDQVATLLTSNFGDALESSRIDFDFPVFEVNKSKIHEIVAFLKSNSNVSFEFLTTLAGIHYPDNTGREFSMMYQLHNMEKNLRIRIKTFMSEKDVVLPTITDLWPASNWMEREAYDFYGFKFIGHPDLRRILNMDEMNYFPLRKEYALEDAGRDDKEDKYFGR
ncbi:MAG: NADH-quinone oxidoreductase subunit C [Flavobacteriales bacterium]|nr:NADH-quinone oxidoreductase subunit C [Flavobacteriales bacterium]